MFGLGSMAPTNFIKKGNTMSLVSGAADPVTLAQEASTDITNSNSHPKEIKANTDFG
jgi:hypothetical protein